MRILTSDGQFFVNANYKIEEKMGKPPQLTCSIPFADNTWIESVKELDRVFTDNQQDEFVIVNPRKITKGDTYELSITAVGGFQFDFAKSFLVDSLGSGTFSFSQLITAVFDGTNYHAELSTRLSDKEKLRFENFGDDNRFKLLERALNRFGVEYKVVGRTVYFDDEVGSDTGFQFRYLKNIWDTEYSIDATNLATSIRGKGAEISEGVPLRVEYTSPLAEIYGKLDYGEISDERMTNKEALLEKCKKVLDASVSVTLETTLLSLKRQEFGEVAHIGDFIWFIDERINLEKKMRFNSVKTYYLSDDSILKQEVVLGDKDAFERYKDTESQQSQNIVNAVEDVRKIAKDAFVVANSGHTIYHASEFIKDEPTGLLKEGDILFLDTGDEVLLYFWDGVEWKRQRLGLDDELKKEYDNQAASLKRAIDEFSKRDEENLAEVLQTVDGFRSEITNAKNNTDSRITQLSNLINQRVSREAIEGIIRNAGDTVMIAIRDKLPKADGKMSGSEIKSALNLTTDGIRLKGDLIHLDGRALIDNAVIKSAMIDKITSANLSAAIIDAVHINTNAVTADKIQVNRALINKLVATEGFFDTVFAKNLISTYIQAVDLSATQIKSGTLRSLNGSMYFDLNNNRLVMTNDNATIRRESAGYPTQFIRYENQENGKIARTIIGSNRDGTDKFNSVSFSGIVIENNSRGTEDGLRLYGDITKLRHAQGDIGWNFQVVNQQLSPATWGQNSEIWARHFVVPKSSNSDTDAPTNFIRLEQSVAALWNIWAHGVGYITMTDAMKNLINGRRAAWGIERNVG